MYNQAAGCQQMKQMCSLLQDWKHCPRKDVAEKHINNTAACHTIDICLFRDKTNREDSRTQTPPSDCGTSRTSYKVQKNDWNASCNFLKQQSLVLGQKKKNLYHLYYHVCMYIKVKGQKYKKNETNQWWDGKRRINYHSKQRLKKCKWSDISSANTINLLVPEFYI